MDGQLDIAVLVAAWESPVVHELLNAKGIGLKGVSRADAFVALYPSVHKLVLPMGVADLIANQPPNDVQLIAIATKASLVVRKDLHPAIQYLLLDAAAQIHSGPGLFRTEGQFPAPESIDLPLSTQARQFYKTGPPFLQRNLPFWLAVLVQQFLVLLIPMAGVLYPLLRIAPLPIRWVQHRRLYKVYFELRLLEDELASANLGEASKSLIERLNQLEDRVSHLWVPASLKPQLYDLRLHINMVREEAQSSAR